MSPVQDPALVVLAAGISSRMKRSALAAGPADASLAREAASKSKSMIPVGPGGRPILDYLMYNAREAGYSDVVIIIGEGDAALRERYGRNDRGNSFHGLSISYALQRIPPGRRKPLGTAEALSCALRLRPDWRGRKFTVCNSDNLYSIGALAGLLETPHAGALIDYDRDALRFGEARIAQFGVIEKDAEGFVKEIIEKPTAEELERVREASGRVGVTMNIFRLSYDMIFDSLEAVPLHPVRDEKELPLAVGLMIRRYPKTMKAIPASEYVPDLTSLEDIAPVSDYLRTHYPSLPF